MARFYRTEGFKKFWTLRLCLPSPKLSPSLQQLVLGTGPQTKAAILRKIYAEASQVNA